MDTTPPTQLVWVSVLTYADGTHDVEVLDAKPTESFLDGISDLDTTINHPRRLVAWEIREGYLNGGDSTVIAEGTY